MKLVIDDLASLETVPCKLRAVGGYRAAQMPYDFTIPDKTFPDSPAQLSGKRGDYVLIHPGGLVDVVTEKDFHKLYQRERPKPTKPAAKPAEAKKP